MLSPRLRVLNVPTAHFASRASTLGLSNPEQAPAARVNDDGTITVESAIRFEGTVMIEETVLTKGVSALAWVFAAPVRRSSDGQYVDVFTPGNAVTGTCLMPVELPTGSVLRGVSVAYIDASNLGNLALTLRRAATGPTSFGSLGIVTASSSGNVLAVRSLDLGALSVPKDGKPLFLQARWTTGNDPIQIAGVEVTYSISTLLP